MTVPTHALSQHDVRANGVHSNEAAQTSEAAHFGQRPRIGSKLIDYNGVGSAYDGHRIPLGSEELCEQIFKLHRILGLESGSHGIAFGCGTGAHELKMLQCLRRREVPVASLTCIDGSEQMLGAARKKLGDSGLAEEINFHVDDLVEGRWDDLSHQAHWATAIQCIHHLDCSDRHFERLGIFLKKAFNRLVAGGVMMVISSTPTQARDPRWYLNILQDVVENPKDDPSWHYANEFPDMSWVIALLREAGFRVSTPRTLFGPYISESVHLGENPEYLFSPEFRAAESVFQLMEQKGLTTSYDRRLRELIDSGALREHILKSEMARKRIGVAYMLRAVKPKH